MNITSISTDTLISNASSICATDGERTIAFVVGVAMALMVGYLMALMQLSGRSLSHVARKGFWQAMKFKNLPEWVEETAREEKEIYALHVILAIREIGGPTDTVPMTPKAWRNVYRLAEHRMKKEKRKGSGTPSRGTEGSP